jgi:hypothetical protein
MTLFGMAQAVNHGAQTQGNKGGKRRGACAKFQREDGLDTHALQITPTP